MFVDPKVIDYFKNEMTLVKIDAEKDTVLAKEFHIIGYPTLVMLDKDGKEIDRMFYAPPDEFLKQAKDYLAGIGTLDDLLKKVAVNPNRDTMFQIADKYKYRGGYDDAEKWYGKVVAAGSPTDSMSGESRMAIADMYRRNKDYNKAVTAFKAVATDFAGKPIVADAEYYIGDTYRRAKDTANAISAYETWMQHNPNADTADVAYVKKVIDKLKNPPPPKAEEKK